MIRSNEINELIGHPAINNRAFTTIMNIAFRGIEGYESAKGSCMYDSVLSKMGKERGVNALVRDGAFTLAYIPTSEWPALNQFVLFINGETSRKLEALRNIAESKNRT